MTEFLQGHVATGSRRWIASRHECVASTIPGGLTDLFGVEATDLYPVQPDHPYLVTAENEEGGELWRLPLELKGAEVVLRAPDGLAAVLSHWGDSQTAVVSFLGDYKVVDTMTGVTAPVTEENGRTLAAVAMKSGAVAVLKATRP